MVTCAEDVLRSRQPAHYGRFGTEQSFNNGNVTVTSGSH
jgi:hypothetical protein